MNAIIKIIFAATIIVALTILSITDQGLNYKEQWWVFIFLGILMIFQYFTSLMNFSEKLKRMSLTELSDYYNEVQEKNDNRKLKIIKKEIRRR